MAAGDFVREMQQTLLTQHERDDPAARTSSTKVLEAEVAKNWDALVAWIEEKLAEINKGFTEPLLLYWKPTNEAFNITNKAAKLSVTVRTEASGNVVYNGTAASGIFRAQIAGDESAYSWERTMSTPSMRVTFGTVGVNVTLDEIGELIIRSVVTP